MPNSEGRSILAVPSRLTRPPSRSSSWPSRATRPKAAPPKSGPKPSPTFISSSLNAYLPREIASYTKNLTVSLGGVPEVARSDNLSAATHELKESQGRALNNRFRAVLDHY